MDALNPKSYMIRCTNVPTILLEKVIAKRYFTTFGRIRSIRIKRKSQCCIIEYVDKGGMSKALEEAGEYRGHKFDVTEDTTGGTPLGKKGHKSSKVPDEMEELESLREELLSKLRKVDPLRASPKASLKTEKLSTRSPKEAKRRSTTTGYSDENTGMAATLTTTSTSSSSSSTEKDLVQILKQPAHTLEEKFKVLDARDKLLRLRQKKRSSIVNADPTSTRSSHAIGSSHSNRATVGTCPDMCPEKERLQRELQHQVALYEQASSSNKGVMDQRLAVKQYSRSSADQDAPLPGELRPVEVLQMTMGYLMHKIVGLCNNAPDVNLAEWYHFLWDRTRSIRKDIIQQELCCQKSVELVEQCARFHIYCSARLVAEDPSVFDQKINTENLTKCLQTLKYMYHDLELKGESCPNEPEFRAYIILLNLNDGNFMWEVQHLRREVQKSKEIRFALEVHSALDQNNYVKFFKLVRSATYLNACLLMRYFVQMRQSALTILVKCYAPRATQAFIPVADLTRNLAFENAESLVDFCEHYGLSVNSEQSHVICDKTSFTLPEFPYMLDRAVNVLESKQQRVSLGEVVCGKRLPERVFDSHVPQNSFDSSTGLLSNLSEFLTDFDLRSQQQAVKTDSSDIVAMAASEEAVEQEQVEDNDNDDDDNMDVEDRPKSITPERIPPKLFDFNFVRSAQQQLDQIDSYDDSGDSRIPPVDDKAPVSSSLPLGSHSVANVTDSAADVPALTTATSTTSSSVDWQNSSSNSSMTSKKSIFGEFSFAAQPALKIAQPAATTAAASFSFVTAAMKDKRDDDVGSKTIADIAQFTQPPVPQTPANRSEVNVKAKRKLLDDDDSSERSESGKKSQSKINEYSFLSAVVKAKNNSAESSILSTTKDHDLPAIKERKIDVSLASATIQQKVDVADKHPTSDAASFVTARQKSAVQKHDPTSDVGKDVSRVLSNLLSKVENNVEKRRLDEIRALIKRRRLRNLALKWREKARLNLKRRNLDFVPEWISSVSVRDKASQLYIGTQEFARSSPKLDLMPSVSMDKITVHDLVYPELLSKICRSDRKVQTEIFWKITLSLPSHQTKFQPITKIFNDYFAWQNKNKSQQFYVEHRQNRGGPDVTYCIEKQEGSKAVTRADSHGYVFVADTFDAELSQRILATLRPLGLYVKVPVVVVLSDSVKNDSSMSKLDVLLRENIVSDYLLLVDRFTRKNLRSMLEKSLRFLAKNCENSTNHLRMDYLRRFLQKYLCGEFWRRISSFGKWNSQYKHCLKKFSLMVCLHNQALDRLKTILLDQRRLEYPEFPEIFRPDSAGTEETCNLPCDYRYFPDFWRSDSYNQHLTRILDSLILPQFDDNDGKWPPKTERDLEIFLASYCRRVFAKAPEKIFYKLMNLLCVEFDLAANFQKNVKNVTFTDLMEVIVLEKIKQTNFSLSGTEFSNKTAFKEFIVVYDSSLLNQYVSSDWFYLKNPKIQREIQTLLERDIKTENSLSHPQNLCPDSGFEPIMEDLDFYLADKNLDRTTTVSLKNMTDDIVRCNLLLQDLSDSYAVHRRIQEKSSDFLQASLCETTTP